MAENNAAYKRIVVDYKGQGYCVGYSVGKDGVYTVYGEAPLKKGFMFRYLPQEHERELKTAIQRRLYEEKGVFKTGAMFRIEYHPGAFGRGFKPEEAPIAKKLKISP
jgi:hypothetical protein